MELVTTKTSNIMLLPNPNSTQNRVPDARELRTLRSIEKSKREFAESIQTRIVEARASYEGAMEQYRAQQLVLESRLSEVHTTKQFLSVLETQKKILDDEMHELRGLLHPIRRCPPEVLSNIFVMTTTPVSPDVYYASYRWPRIQAYNILRVCRYWRDVALQCPQLWAVIPICLNDGLTKLRTCWELSVKRVKHAPVSICIVIRSHHGKKDYFEKRRQHFKDAFGVCDLRQIRNISTLRFEGCLNVGVTQVLSLMTHFPTGSLEWLELGPYWGMQIAPLEWWSWTTFLQRFLPFTSLEVKGAQDLGVDEGTVFPALKRLHLDGHYFCRLAGFLAACPNLEYLRVEAMFDGVIRPGSEYQIYSLKEFVIRNVLDFPWGQVKAPNLASLRFENEDQHDSIDDECIDFLSKSPHLVSLELVMPWESLVDLARATDTILHLELELREAILELFLRWEETGLTGPPFTKLKSLLLFYSEDDVDDDVPAFLYFDELVSKRCLPPSNPASRVAAPLMPLETLIIKQHPDIPSTWMNSIHYQTTTARIIKQHEDYSSVTLSWALNEDDVWE